jgi:hypothetical protein
MNSTHLEKDDEGAATISSLQWGWRRDGKRGGRRHSEGGRATEEEDTAPVSSVSKLPERKGKRRTKGWPANSSEDEKGLQYVILKVPPPMEEEGKVDAIPLVECSLEDLLPAELVELILRQVGQLIAHSFVEGGEQFWLVCGRNEHPHANFWLRLLCRAGYL